MKRYVILLIALILGILLVGCGLVPGAAPETGSEAVDETLIENGAPDRPQFREGRGPGGPPPEGFEPPPDGFERPADGFGREPIGGMMEIIAEETDLDIAALQEQAASGATLAEIIEANGGDVEAVQARLAASIAESTDLTAEEVEQRVADMLNGSFSGGGFGGPPPNRDQ